MQASYVNGQTYFGQADKCELKRKKENAPAKPPPPTLPKPKFILPQTATTNLVMQRCNLKAKSELNIATPVSFSSSTSSASSTSSTANSLDIVTNGEQRPNLTAPNQPTKLPLKNKFLENHSVVSSSQGYHSDSWESQSSRQSIELDARQAVVAPSRYKHFAKISSKITSEPKLSEGCKSSPESTGHSSDGSSSINGLGSSDELLNENKSNFHKSILIEKPASGSTSSTASTSSSGSCNSGTTLSSANSCFSAVVASEPKSEESKRASNNGGVELPIYYQANVSSVCKSNDASKNEVLVSNYSAIKKLPQNSFHSSTNPTYITQSATYVDLSVHGQNNFVSLLSSLMEPFI